MNEKKKEANTGKYRLIPSSGGDSRQGSGLANRRKLRGAELFFHIGVVRIRCTRRTLYRDGRGDGYFPSGKKTFANSVSLPPRSAGWIVFQREIRTAPSYIRLTSEVGLAGEGGDGGFSGYTSDKWWIANKWGISAGNIRDIKKETPPLLVIRILLEKPRAPRLARHIRHLDRLKSDATKLFLSNDRPSTVSFVGASGFLLSCRRSAEISRRHRRWKRHWN